MEARGCSHSGELAHRLIKMAFFEKMKPRRILGFCLAASPWFLIVGFLALGGLVINERSAGSSDQFETLGDWLKSRGFWFHFWVHFIFAQPVGIYLMCMKGHQERSR
jgi:hypothetical protein